MTATFARISTNDDSARQSGRVDDFVERLSHPSAGRISSSLMLFLQTMVSFGLLPLILWPSRWADFVEGERRDLIDLAGWWEHRADPRQRADLQKITRRLRRRPVLMIIPWLIAGFNVVIFAMVLFQGGNLERIINLTFKHAVVYRDQHSYEMESSVHHVGGHDEVHVFPTLSNRADPPLESRLYYLWMTSLCVGYFCQWYAVRSHAVVVHSLVSWINRVARESQLWPIKSDVLKIGLRPLGILFAVILCSWQIWWVIPLVFAASMQRRYCGQSGPGIRIALGGQTRQAFAATRSGPDRFCNSKSCGTRLPLRARFCSRCGVAV